MFAQRGIEPALELDPEPVPVRGDWARLVQVVGNLLQYAAKFSGPGSRTVVSLRRLVGAAQLSVRDTGVGIAPKMLDRLFQPFSQIDSSLDRGRGGLGLGLALARRLVEMHGGQVAARSDGLGRGAKFVVRLPMATERVAARQVDPTRVAPWLRRWSDRRDGRGRDGPRGAGSVCAGGGRLRRLGARVPGPSS